MFLVEYHFKNLAVLARFKNIVIGCTQPLLAQTVLTVVAVIFLRCSLTQEGCGEVKGGDRRAIHMRLKGFAPFNLSLQLIFCGLP
jgi:uncharacterized membrane protein